MYTFEIQNLCDVKDFDAIFPKVDAAFVSQIGFCYQIMPAYSMVRHRTSWRVTSNGMICITCDDSTASGEGYAEGVEDRGWGVAWGQDSKTNSVYLKEKQKNLETK